MARPTKSFEGVDYSAVEVKRDGLGRTYFSERAGTSPRAVRFGKLQMKVLKGHVRFDTPLQAFAASLILFDGIATRKSIIPALAAAPLIYQWRNRAQLEWPYMDGRIDRRILSGFSTDFIKSLPEEISHRYASDNLMLVARTIYPGAPDPIGTLLGDAQAWLLDVLPGALLGHVLGTNPQAALPRTALAREVRKEALSLDVAQVEGMGSEALGFALDAYFEAPETTGSAWLVDELVVICRRNAKFAEADDKRRMLQALLHLSHKAVQCDAISALILAWTADLVESGTRLAPDIHPGTVGSYVRLVAQALRNHLLGYSVSELSDEQFAEVYQRIVAGVSDGQKRNARSALSSWHAFLIRWLNAPPLKVSLYDPKDDAVPRANIIWPHEMDMIEEWLDHASMDKRLREQLVVAFAIARHVRIRAGELFRLRLHSIQDIDDTLTIEVCPLFRDGRLKTASARRSLVVNDHLSSNLILDWKACRKKEGALGEDLLFGDPHKPERIYQQGKYYVLINKILKAVSGDREVSLHTLSHTWISGRIHAALMSNEREIDIDPLDEIAVRAGHMTVQTSLDHYFHLFEKPIRHRLDAALAKIKLTSADAARLSGVAATALRARASYRKADCHAIYWEAIFAQHEKSDFPCVAEKIATYRAESPATLSVSHMTRFADVLHALGDIAEGKPLHVVASRCGRNADWAERIALMAAEVLRDLPALPNDRLNIRSGLTTAQAAVALNKLGTIHQTGFDYSRVGQPKYSGLLAHLDRACFDEQMQVTLDAWQRCHAGLYLRLDDSVDARTILAFLHSSNVASDQLAISIQSANPEYPSPEERALAADLVLPFTRCFGVSAMLNWTKRRGGRPRSFLIWSSVPLVADGDPAGAATSLTGFNAIMLAAAVHQAMQGVETASSGTGRMSSTKNCHA